MRISDRHAGQLLRVADARRSGPLATQDRNCCLPKTFRPGMPVGIFGDRSITTIGAPRLRGKSANLAGISERKMGIKPRFWRFFPQGDMSRKSTEPINSKWFATILANCRRQNSTGLNPPARKPLDWVERETWAISLPAHHTSHARQADRPARPAGAPAGLSAACRSDKDTNV
jgi:hypothetical protein